MTIENIPNVSPQAPISPFSEFNIGSLLLRMGKITPADAERIMLLHKQQGVRFGEAAKNLGLITESDIQDVLARQFDYPYLNPEDDGISSSLIAAYQPFGPKAESFRALRSQLIFNWFAKNRKVLAISGVDAGVGASYLIANLAVVFSQLGENTLLIDANLRHPTQHNLFGLKGGRGLSDILAGRAAVDVINKVNAFESLSVLAAGTLPPNPLELVSKANFRSLIKSLSNSYDIILVDTPAFSESTDSQAIASAAGGVVMVIRKNITKMNAAAVAIDQLQKNGTHVVGTVLSEF
ncbi:chain length determinant protein tyrosine kinase EpsG [Methylobacillus caricis]|uniref:chain length determinant protein tyrosine kinase EpsG n=1 Tax=Methylobacillus caricis TaxID=1971611 RepID=UPI001D001572|nr:chain length determinant protein tyrosine kinase EpsG [Methylobacillus caricis]MCB5188083.1 chain length determinant protein tyrosine kinase EpsG [Methylobacillus caricis]